MCQLRYGHKALYQVMCFKNKNGNKNTILLTYFTFLLEIPSTFLSLYSLYNALN